MAKGRVTHAPDESLSRDYSKVEFASVSIASKA